LILPAVSFLTAKTKKRTLSINQEGIETKIGSKEGKIPWQAVENIVAMTIPSPINLKKQAI
jgi:hypothetical protein